MADLLGKMVPGRAGLSRCALPPEALVVPAGVLSLLALWPLGEILSALPGLLYAATPILRYLNPTVVVLALLSAYALMR